MDIKYEKDKIKEKGYGLIIDDYELYKYANKKLESWEIVIVLTISLLMFILGIVAGFDMVGVF